MLPDKDTNGMQRKTAVQAAIAKMMRSNCWISNNFGPRVCNTPLHFSFAT
jgi:hypothetical protein